MRSGNRVWKPTPLQERALMCPAFEILFGGARGGGKTEAGLVWLLFNIKNPQYVAVVLRKHFIDLKEWLGRAKRFYKPFGAEFKDGGRQIVFPSGASIFTGHLKEEDAYTRYQGWEIHKLLIEEASHIPDEALYEKLLASVRSTTNINPQVFLTSNPDGPGADWLMRRFRIDDIAQNNKMFKAESGTRIYIPATVDDNPYLKEKDPRYVKYLESLPSKLRDMWRYGRWGDYDIEGAYYAEILKRARDAGRITNIPIEPQLPTVTAWDLGIHDYNTIWVIQVYGRELRAVAYYENCNEGLNHYVNWLGDFRKSYGVTYTKHYAPHDVKVRELTSGRSRLEIANEMGIAFEVAPNISIADGINATRNVLENMFFDIKRCERGIKALRKYRKEYDVNKQVFKDRPIHDWTSHAADAMRIFAVSYNATDMDKTNTQSSYFDIHKYSEANVGSWEAI